MAVRLLKSLLDEVDDARRPAAPGKRPGGKERGVRAVVALSVASAVLATTGVAAAGWTSRSEPDKPAESVIPLTPKRAEEPVARRAETASGKKRQLPAVSTQKLVKDQKKPDEAQSFVPVAPIMSRVEEIRELVKERLRDGTWRLAASLFRVDHAVDVAPGVLPGDVVDRVGVQSGLVHPGLALVQQVAEVPAQQIPVDVVGFAAVLALDGEPAHAQWLQERPENFKISQVGQHVFPLG